MFLFNAVNARNDSDDVNWAGSRPEWRRGRGRGEQAKAKENEYRETQTPQQPQQLTANRKQQRKAEAPAAQQAVKGLACVCMKEWDTYMYASVCVCVFAALLDAS